MTALKGDKYDGTPWGLRVFMESVKVKALMYHWTNVLSVPDVDSTKPDRDFLTMTE
jgi:hypothetical protein